MKKNKTLQQLVHKLHKKELIRYASNLGVEFDEKWNVLKIRNAYVEHILPVSICGISR